MPRRRTPSALSTIPRLSSHLPSPHPPLQLDVYFETPLSTYKKLLLGVLAEHLLIAAKLLMQALAPDAPEFLQADARLAEQV